MVQISSMFLNSIVFSFLSLVHLPKQSIFRSCILEVLLGSLHKSMCLTGGLSESRKKGKNPTGQIIVL